MRELVEKGAGAQNKDWAAADAVRAAQDWATRWWILRKGQGYEIIVYFVHKLLRYSTTVTVWRNQNEKKTLIVWGL